jgi:glutamyl-tRNA synthetase
LLHVSRAAAALDVDKLEWMNLQHMLRADSTRLAAILAEQLRCLGIDPAGRELVAIVEAQRGRVKTVREMAERSALFFSPPATYDADAVAQHLAEDGLPLLAEVREQLGSLAAWDPIEIEAAVRHVATVRGLAFGAVAQSLRVAVAGGSVSPPIDQTLAILGRDEALARLQAAAAFLSKSAA